MRRQAENEHAGAFQLLLDLPRNAEPDPQAVPPQPLGELADHGFVFGAVAQGDVVEKGCGHGEWRFVERLILTKNALKGSRGVADRGVTGRANSLTLGTGMRAVNLSYAKTHLDRLVDEARAGEEIVISEAGATLVRLAPVPLRKKRVFGLDHGKIVIRDEFDAPLPELESLSLRPSG
jgi:antitoxin (DNA-binding transcriptional repressor) of toxin-antitoxin stability system